MKPNGATAENEVVTDEENESGEEDEDDDDDDDDNYVGDEDIAAPSLSLTKKRSIDEVNDKEASQGSKKIKA